MRISKFGAIKKNKHPESEICKALWNWFQWQFPAHKDRYLRLECGGQRTKLAQAILKAEGNKAGTSDLFIAVPSKLHHGLFLEIKSDKGRATQNQKDFHTAMRPDYYCTFAFGITECKSVIVDYMALCGYTPAYPQQRFQNDD